MINHLKSLYKFFSPRFQSVHLDYKVNVKPRYGHGKPAKVARKAITENQLSTGIMSIDPFPRQTLTI